MKSPVFSIPFNGDLALVKSALASGRVSEVYFSPWSRHLRAANYFGAGENNGNVKIYYSATGGTPWGTSGTRGRMPGSLI